MEIQIAILIVDNERIAIFCSYDFLIVFEMVFLEVKILDFSDVLTNFYIGRIVLSTRLGQGFVLFM